MARKQTSKKQPASTPKPSNKGKPKPASKNLSSPEPATLTSAGLQCSQDQQRLLNLCSDAFNSVLSSPDFPNLLREIKQALFNRDFAAAFGREDYLQAYAARWSPTRALCYASVLLSIRSHLDETLVSSETVEAKTVETANSGPDTVDVTQTAADGVEKPVSEDAAATENGTTKRLKMVSIGGCAAEHLAFASYLHDTNTTGNLTLLDSAPWSNVTTLLQTKITTPPPLSKYASAAIKASNKALLIPGRLSLTFVQQDVLSLAPAELAEIVPVGETPTLVTMMFTLNELYTSGGIAKTTRLLKSLGQVLASGSLVLVVDSPGSYSEAALGKEKKRYPMQWLVDHTLLETETLGYMWQKLESHESVWFRLPEGLSYPIPLENMRYQLHLYQLNKDI